MLDELKKCDVCVVACHLSILIHATFGIEEASQEHGDASGTVANPMLQAFPSLIQKAMEEDTASLDVYLSSPGVKPRCVSSSAEHLGEATIEQNRFALPNGP